MELLDALRQRRSVKKFDPDHKMTDDEIRHLISNSLLAPTSFNIQNRHFVVVRDPEVKTKLHSAAFHQDQVRDASVVIVLAANNVAHRATDRILRNAPAKTREMLSSMIKQYYDGNAKMRLAEACRTAGLSAMALMLVAKDMGYDTCPMIGFVSPAVSAALDLPADFPPQLLIPVGKALEPAHPRMGFFSLEETVSLDHFGNHGLKGEIDEA